MGYRHVVVTAKGGPEVLAVREEAQLPEPGPGEVRVKVLAAGTGFTDTAIRRGNYPDVKDPHPFTPGYDFVGEVDRLGSGVSGLVPGQRVLDMPVIGGYSQYVVRPVASLIALPERYGTLDPAALACLPLSYQTAYQMLHRFRRFEPGARILIQGASGAVGTALLDVGRALGLRMLGTCSPAKFSLVERYGATAIDYRGGDIVGRVRAWSGDGAGVDAVFDAIGGHRQWADAMRCLRPGGLLVAYGAQHIARGEDSLFSVLWGFAKLFGWWSWAPAGGRRAAFYQIASRRKQKPDEYREDIGALLDMLARGRIQPLIAARRPLRDARAVHEDIDAGRISGKVILLPWAE